MGVCVGGGGAVNIFFYPRAIFRGGGRGCFSVGVFLTMVTKKGH